MFVRDSYSFVDLGRICIFKRTLRRGKTLFITHKTSFCREVYGMPRGRSEKIKSEFDMRTRKSMLQGGEIFEDEVLIPGQGEKSYLYILSTRVEEDLEMPP